jgi:cytochrome c-type biogenesis protein CcsB
MGSPLLALALASYLLATAAFVGHVFAESAALQRSARWLLAAAFVAHLTALATRAFLLGIEAITPFPEALSFIACVMVGLYLLIASRANLTVVGGLVAPLAFLFTLSAYLFEAGTPVPAHRLQSVWLPAHFVPAFIGYAVFAVAFCLSLTYLLQEKQLKGKRKSHMFRRLPSLETLDNLNYRFVSWGFGLFTIGLITGSLLAREVWGALWSWEPVQVWSVVTWLLYAALLHARTVGWRGRKAATLTIVSFVVLVMSFVGVNLVFPGKHGSSLG